MSGGYTQQRVYTSEVYRPYRRSTYTQAGYQGRVFTYKQQVELEHVIDVWLRENSWRDSFHGETWALLVRLAFHEAHTSGSLGCLAWAPVCDHSECEYNNPQNKGLQGITDLLSQFWDEAQIGSRYGLSTGDFWVLTEMVAIRQATGGYLSIPFWYGRPECTGRRYWGDSIPHGTDGLQTIQSEIGQKFGFELEETVAIFGAHSLGRMSRANTHFEGSWTHQMALLDNTYFKNLWGSTWQSQVNPDGYVQWYNRQGLSMLTSDISLAFNHGQSRSWCDGTNYAMNQYCGARGDDWSHWVERFANDNAEWSEYFGSAMDKMWQWGNHGLSLAQGYGQ